MLKSLLSVIHNNRLINNGAVQLKRTMHSADLKSVFTRAIANVQPSNLMPEFVSISDRHLIVKGDKYLLKKPCHVVGFGKAVYGMAIELERILKDDLCGGIVSVPKGILNTYNHKAAANGSRLRFIEGARNNLPDEDSMNAAREIKDYVAALTADDFLIVLISGGGSALLPLPKSPITLAEKLDLIERLSKSGADIKELNCVRKRLSQLKGGNLARIAYPARIVSLILSDVIGDPLDLIASGPTVIDRDSSADARNVLRKYSIYGNGQLAESIENALMNDVESIAEHETFERVANYVIGNNRLAAEAAKKHAERLGYVASILSTTISGDVARLSRNYGQLARELSVLITNPTATTNNLRSLLNDIQLDYDIDVGNFISNTSYYGKRVCVIGAGEPTVFVTGSGKGGRNQQLALSFALDANQLDATTADVSFLSCGTDGIDGPTDAAGAFVTSDLIGAIQRKEIDPSDRLINNDAYNFFSEYSNGENLIRIGHTGTNVMDLHILMITPRQL